MRKSFTKFVALFVLSLCTFSAAMAQTVLWPTADTNTINASQFKGAGSLVRYTTASTDITTWGIPATYRGWVTHGLTSSVPTKRDSAVWTWSGNGTQGGGLYGGNTPINSPTVGNGIAVFNSDYLDTRGSADGTGPAPSPHSGEMISPIMNLTGVNSPTVQINQFYRNFASRCYVAYSRDSGRTWSNLIQLNGEITSNASTDNTSVTSTVKTVRLAGAVGNNAFRIKFVFDGDAYFWVVDDVKIINLNYDMQISTFNALPPNFVTPASQVEPIRFLADARNSGLAMPNAKLNVTVWRITRNAAGAETARTVVHTGTFNYGTFPADSTIENKIIPGTFTPPAVAAEYLGRYKVSGDSLDAIPSNDSFNFPFYVSDTSSYNYSTVLAGFPNGARTNFAKDNGTSFAYYSPTAAFWPTATEPRAYRVGAVYFMPKKNNTITRIAFNLANLRARGNTVRGAIYTWIDANRDDIIQPSERSLLGIADTLVPDTLTQNNTVWYAFNMTRLNGQPIITNDTTQYLATLEVNNTINVTSPIFTAFTSQDYGATGFLADSLRSPRYNMLLGRTSTDDWSTGGFVGLAPVVRIFVYPFRVNTNDILSDNNKMDIFPNPANGDYITVNVELEKAQQAGIRITSIDGRVISDQETGLIQKDAIRVNTNELANGTYLIQLLTQEGVKTRKLVINR